MPITKPFLKVAAGQWNPWCNMILNERNETYIEGPMGDILRILAQHLNFNYEIVQPPDELWGYHLGNGTWVGMMGMVHRKEVEFALGPFSITDDRESILDFTPPIHHGRESILTLRPSIKNDIQGLIRPFTMNVWLLVLMSLVIISFSLMLIQKAEGKLFRIKTDEIPAKSIMWAFKAVTQEGSEWLPEKDAGRLLVTVWLLASLVFMTSYSGILTAMLTAPRVTIPIDSLEDLVSQTKIPFRLESTHLFNYFKLSKDNIHQKAFQTAAGTIYSCWDSKEDIAVGEFSAICPEMTLKKVISWDYSTTGGCRLYKARNVVYANDLNAVAFVTNSSYLEGARRVIDSLKESGIMGYWIAQRTPNITQCFKPPTSDQSDSTKALNIEAIGGPLILLLGGLRTRSSTWLLASTILFFLLGYVVAVVLFLAECLYSLHCQQS